MPLFHRVHLWENQTHLIKQRFTFILKLYERLYKLGKLSQGSGSSNLVSADRSHIIFMPSVRMSVHESVVIFSAPTTAGLNSVRILLIDLQSQMKFNTYHIAQWRYKCAPVLSLWDPIDRRATDWQPYKKATQWRSQSAISRPPINWMPLPWPA